jgi:hypothetical protein
MSKYNISDADATLIDNNLAKLVGQGPWLKNSAYQVYQVLDRFVAVVVEDQMNCWILMETAEYITEDKIPFYIGD